MLLVTALPTALAAGGIFSDVPDGAWYADAVAYVHDNGIMNGTSETTFGPNAPMTRAMLVTVLYRAEGSPSVTGAAPFTDVASGVYYADAVAWASDNGLVTGYGDGRFGANDPVSRAQIATILWRYAGSPSAVAGQDFADESSIPAYASAAVDWARANGVVNGTTGGRFDPQGDATRAQVATILRNYLTRTPSDPQPDPDRSGKVLVAYYSATGSTEAVAKTIADELGADLFAITPTAPYTSADLNWNDADSRVSREHADESLRDVPLTTTTVADWGEYDTVFLGYPIWWGVAAWPVDGFVRDNDFTGKTVVPFCTSASSGLGQSASLLEQLAGSGDWQSGQRFSSGVSDSTVRDWAAGLGLGG